MDKEIFYNLIETLDKEIKAYEKLKEYFEAKKNLLKSAKPDDLGILDNKILALNNTITRLNKQRAKIATEITGEDANMSRLIQAAEELAPDFTDALKERKVKICNIIPELVLLNNQNVELLKHGITITNKMLESIVDAFAPQGCNYNGAGKTDSHEYDMWTVNEQI